MKAKPSSTKMPNFFYTAKSFKGESKTGSLVAKDELQLAKKLREQGLLLIKAKTEKEIKKRKLEISLPFFGGVSLTEKIFFIKN